MLFPSKDSTIGEGELKQMVRYLDSNNDTRVSLKEVNDWFQINKQKISNAFQVRLEKSFDILDGLTYRPTVTKEPEIVSPPIEDTTALPKVQVVSGGDQAVGGGVVSLGEPEILSPLIEII